MAAAVAAVIVTVIAVTGSLSSPVHRTGDSSAAGTPSASHSSASRSGSQNVQDGSASRDPSRKPEPARSARVSPSDHPASHPQSRADELCRDFFAYFLHPQPHDKLLAEITLFWQIVALAGNPPHFDVNSYCAGYVRDMFPRGVPNVPWSPGGGPMTPQAGQNGAGNGNQGAQPGVTTGAPGQANKNPSAS
jgi:hypothetical protein